MQATMPTTRWDRFWRISYETGRTWGRPSAMRRIVGALNKSKKQKDWKILVYWCQVQVSVD